MTEVKWSTELFKVWDGKKFWREKISIVNGIDELFCGEVDELVFLQNSFCKDKNGEDIYVGDIVRTIDDEGDYCTYEDIIEPVVLEHGSFYPISEKYSGYFFQG